MENVTRDERDTMHVERQEIAHQIVHGIKAVPGGWIPHPRGHGRLAVVRDGYKVHEVDGKKRGKRGHTFHDLASFAAWLNRHATDHERCEIVMNAVMNGTDPKNLGNTVAHLAPQSVDGDRVECQIAQHPVWLAWFAILGKDLDQIKLAEHVRCYRDSLGTEGSVLLSALQQIKVVAGGSTEVQVGALGEIKLLAGDRRTEASVTLPPELLVRTPIFDGVLARDATPDSPVEAEYVLRLFVSMQFVEERPVFRLTCPGLAIVLRKALHDAHEDLVARLHPDFLVGFGVPKVDAVPFIEMAPAPAPSTPAPAPSE